ncbi:MAG: hypothetical protein J6N52_09300 [Clostridia bacterium]|nr:hypothetical protein [Clostridia bacterium]
MNDEKDLLNQDMPEEDNTEIENDAVEAESVAETVDTINDESDSGSVYESEEDSEVFSSESEQDVDETGNDYFSDGSVIPEIPEKKSEISKPAVAAISVVITLIVSAAACFTWYMTSYNPYNANKDGYVLDLAAYAKLYGQTVDEMKEQHGLPKDMREDTIAEVAMMYSPMSKVAERYGMTVKELMSASGMGDMEVEDDTPQGVVQKAMLEKEISQMQEQQAENVAEEEADGENADTEASGEEGSEPAPDSTESTESTEATTEAPQATEAAE